MYKIVYFVPVSHLAVTKKALFQAGAGQYPKYSETCWQVLGQGQFRPLKGSKPALGQQGQLETVDEYRVEMLCDEACFKQALIALIEAHPYEEPAVDVYKLDYPK